MSNKEKLLSCQNDINRYFEQAQSTIIAVSHTDNVEELDPSIMLNILWLIQDRLEDIKNTADQITSIAREAV